MVRPSKEAFIETSLKECLEQINLKLDNHLKHTEDALDKTSEELNKTNTRISDEFKITNDRIAAQEKLVGEIKTDLNWIKYISITVLGIVLTTAGGLAMHLFVI